MISTPLSLISVIRVIRGLKMGQGRKTHYLYIRAYARVSFLRQTRQVRHGILLDIMVLGAVLPLGLQSSPLGLQSSPLGLQSSPLGLQSL